jgi:hypothetical protein
VRIHILPAHRPHTEMFTAEATMKNPKQVLVEVAFTSFACQPLCEASHP